MSDNNNHNNDKDIMNGDYENIQENEHENVFEKVGITINRDEENEIENKSIQHHGSFDNLDKFNDLQNLLEFSEHHHHDQVDLQYNFMFPDDNININNHHDHIFNNIDLPLIDNEQLYYHTNKISDNYDINKNNQYNNNNMTEESNQQSINLQQVFKDNNIINNNNNHNKNINKNIQNNNNNKDVDIKNNNNNIIQMGFKENNIYEENKLQNDIQQTQNINQKQIKEYIENDQFLQKKYHKKIACPNCNQSNLETYEINSTESIFMCTHPNCCFPLEDEELSDYTFQTKYKKRFQSKIKNKILFKFNPPLNVIYEQQDIQKALEYIQANMIN